MINKQRHNHVVYSFLFPSSFLLAASKYKFFLRNSTLISFGRTVPIILCDVAGMVNFQVPVFLHGIWTTEPCALCSPGADVATAFFPRLELVI